MNTSTNQKDFELLKGSLLRERHQLNMENMPISNRHCKLSTNLFEVIPEGFKSMLLGFHIEHDETLPNDSLQVSVTSDSKDNNE